MPKKSLVETYRHDISVKIFARMGAVMSHTQKELAMQAKKVEQLAQRLEAKEGRSRRNN